MITHQFGLGFTVDGDLQRGMRDWISDPLAILEGLPLCLRKRLEPCESDRRRILLEEDLRRD